MRGEEAQEGRDVRGVEASEKPRHLENDFSTALFPLPSSLRLVGFAAETDHVLAEAARKCREKGLSFIVANDVTKKGCGFGTDTNRVTFVFPDGTQKKFPLMTKRMVAKRILDALSSVATGRAG